MDRRAMERRTFQARLKRGIDVRGDAALGGLKVEAFSESLFIAKLFVDVLCQAHS